MAQTTYTEKEATDMLEKYNGDYLQIIKNYMGIENKTEIKKKPYHQIKLDIIRETLDKANLAYREKKEKECGFN